jgi:lipopolysaccharide/colanic/teichoic acid biosynthesis glycosyltransferase
MPEPITIAVMGGGITGLALRFARRGFHELKRALDLVGASLLLLVLGPVVLFVAALIKLESKGPAFFSQIRVGKDGKLFRIIKLRTMRADAEKATGPVWARKQDNRITRLGSFLRKAHIDEFPQLINVLRGEMSLIGPRPERPFFVNRFRREIPNYEHRLAVKPGITGLAQVRYKYDESLADVRNKLTYDLVYIKRMSPVMDARILLWTFGTMNGHNAN